MGVAQLSGLIQHPPSSPDENDVRQYHDILELLESASGEHLSVFRISEDRLAPNVSSIRPGGYRRGGGSVRYTEKKYCDDRYFYSQLHALANFTMILQQEDSARPMHTYELCSDDQLKDMLLERGIKPKKQDGTPGFDRAIAISQLDHFPNPQSPSPQPLTIHAHGSNFNINSPGSSVTQTIRYQSEDFRDLLGKLNEVSQYDEYYRMKCGDEVRANVTTLGVQIGSPKPNQSIIAQSLRSPE